MTTDETVATERLLKRLFDWATTEAADPDLERGLDHAVYDRGVRRLTIEEFLWGIRHGAPLEDVRLIAMVAQAEKGALMYEAKDPVTGLRHRFVWFVERDGGNVARIVEVIGQVE